MKQLHLKMGLPFHVPITFVFMLAMLACLALATSQNDYCEAEPDELFRYRPTPRRCHCANIETVDPKDTGESILQNFSNQKRLLTTYFLFCSKTDWRIWLFKWLVLCRCRHGLLWQEKGICRDAKDYLQLQNGLLVKKSPHIRRWWYTLTQNSFCELMLIFT